MASPTLWSRILGRLLTGLVVAWASVTAAFLALHALPGRIEDILAGDVDTPGLREAIAAEWGLDRSLFAQYWAFVSRIAGGDLGTSYVLRQPVREIVGSQLWPTVQLALTAGVLAVVLAVVVALLTAGRGRLSQKLASALELVLASTPVFWIGIVLLMLFSFTLRWFPVSGANGWQALVLPSIALALPTAGLLAQVLDLLGDLRARLGTALLFISHDLGVIQHLADRVLVFHHGRLVEHGPVGTVLTIPADPSTRALLASQPRLDQGLPAYPH